MARHHDDQEQYDEVFGAAYRRLFDQMIADGGDEYTADLEAKHWAGKEAERDAQAARDNADECRISRYMFDREFA